MYRQDQFASERGQYFYLIAYAAPLDLYDKYPAAMERAIESSCSTWLWDDWSLVSSVA